MRFARKPKKRIRTNPVGKHMKKKPPQELLRGYGHQLLLVVMRIIFPPERDLAICKATSRWLEIATRCV